MKISRKILTLLLLALLFPVGTQAQDVEGLHGILDQLYQEMIPLCSELIGIGQGIAGFAALWYIASRVWRHLSNAEPIDFYPLLRPFAIGLCIMLFPGVISVINGVLKPTVTGTASLVEGSNIAIERLLEQREQALMQTDKWQMYMGQNGAGDYEKWHKYTYDGEGSAGDSFWESIGNDLRFAMSKAGYQLRHSIKEWLSQVLQLLFVSASLCINALRTFQLVVLAILGPLVFGIAVFDGFQHTLTVWLARYINVFLWLPVANILGAILGKIQEKMIQLDLSQIGEAGDTFFTPTDTGYLVFLIMGIIGYLSVPSVANYIVHAASSGALPQKISSVFTGVASSKSAIAGAGVTAAAGMFTTGGSMAADALGNGASRQWQSMAGQGQSSPYFQSGNDYMSDKLKGKS